MESVKLHIHEGLSDGKLERRKYFFSSCLGFLLLKFLVLEIQWIKSQWVCIHIVKNIWEGLSTAQGNKKSTNEHLFLKSLF